MPFYWSCRIFSLTNRDIFTAQPLLNPYEAHVALGAAEWKDVYPMDFYAKGAGPWGNYYQPESEVCYVMRNSLYLMFYVPVMHPA